MIKRKRISADEFEHREVEQQQLNEATSTLPTNVVLVTSVKNMRQVEKVVKLYEFLKKLSGKKTADLDKCITESIFDDLIQIIDKFIQLQDIHELNLKFFNNNWEFTMK